MTEFSDTNFCFHQAADFIFESIFMGSQTVCPKLCNPFLEAKPIFKSCTAPGTNHRLPYMTGGNVGVGPQQKHILTGLKLTFAPKISAGVNM